MWHRTAHLGRRLVLAQPFIDDVAQKVVFRPPRQTYRRSLKRSSTGPRFVSVEGFYQSLGFTATAAPYDDFDVAHVANGDARRT
jgi:hypothetical protein